MIVFDAAPAPAGLFVVTTGSLRDVGVLEAYAAMVFKPAQVYFDQKMLVERPDQIDRMRLARVIGPLHAATTPPDAVDIDEMVKVFRFFEHPDFASVAAGMKSGLSAYKLQLEQIPPLSRRRDTDGNDTFKTLRWWRGQIETLPNWVLALRGVLAHAPSSAAAERIFSILNNSFDADQGRSLADYKELSLQLQYNKRGRSCDDDIE